MTWRAIKWTGHAATTVVVDDPAGFLGERVIAECDREDEARLIAAARELLAALERFQNDAFDFGMPLEHPCRAQARAAIAKVKGSDPLDDAIDYEGGRFTL